MTKSVRRLLIGRDRAVTRYILLVAAALSLAAFGTLAAPALWSEYVSVSGAATLQQATAVGFVISILAAVHGLSTISTVNPYVPTAAVFVVLISIAVTGVVTGSQLMFFIAPSIFLGVLATLAAYANDGAVASLSVVFFPVFGYMINAPYGIAATFSSLDRVRVALLFAILFTFSIGIASFLIGATIRRLIEYANLFTVEELTAIDELDGVEATEFRRESERDN